MTLANQFMTQNLALKHHRNPGFVSSILIIAFLAGCASLRPGSDFPKTVTSALAHPEETRLGRQFKIAAREHGGNSGFRLLSVRADGFLTRAQMANVAERTLNLQ